MSLLIRKPGLLTTVQDMGRWGYQAIGMPVAGAMDTFALRAGNLALGNDPGAAGLEITLVGPELEFQSDRAVIIAGADTGARLNGKTVPVNTVFLAGRGDVLGFIPGKGGTRCWLCISGGVDVPMVMGSRSTYLRGKLGGVDGRALKSGDIVPLGEPYILWKRTAGFVIPAECSPDSNREIRVMAGPQEEMFTSDGLETFYGSTYKLGAEADRMGCRLEGPVIEHVECADILSDAIPFGAVQVPGHGLPIIMLADRQTTGGYSKIATVIGADLPLLAQMVPGNALRFRKVDMQEAVTASREKLRELEAVRIAAADYRSRSVAVRTPTTSGKMKLTVNDRVWDVEWEQTDVQK